MGLSTLLLTLGVLAAPPTPIPTQTASSHPMRYDLALPTGWTRERRWPVVVVIPDAHREFKANLDAFVKARGDAPFILVAPHVLTCGGAGVRSDPPYAYSAATWKDVDRVGDFRFDADGIAAVMKDVEKRYGGEPRYFLTGWEAGGHTVWAMLFQHPEALRAVAPVSSNYKGRWTDEASYSRAATRADLPVKVLFCGAPTGDAKAGVEFFMSQTREAMKVAEAHGFRKVSLETAPGKPHGPLAEEVLAFFSSLLATPAR